MISHGITHEGMIGHMSTHNNPVCGHQENKEKCEDWNFLSVKILGKLSEVAWMCYELGRKTKSPKIYLSDGWNS